MDMATGPTPVRRPRAHSLPESDTTVRTASPQDASAPLARSQARAAVAALRKHGVRPPGRLLDLCAGLGRQARSLAEAGYRPLGVDIRHDDEIRAAWTATSRRRSQPHFLAADARALPLRGPFDAVLLLHNSLSLFHTNDDAMAVLREIRRVIAPRGVLLIDNVCRRLWQEIAAGRYADGISEDGLWQMIWLPGRNVFALRYAENVRADRPRPGRGEVLYRAWSLDELELLCRLTGWSLQPQSLRQGLLVARPQE